VTGRRQRRKRRQQRQHAHELRAERARARRAARRAAEDAATARRLQLIRAAAARPEDLVATTSRQPRPTRPGERRPRAADKTMDALVAAAWDAGWECKASGTEHVKVRPQGAARWLVSIPGTPSSRRTVPNLTSRLRSAGVEI